MEHEPFYASGMYAAPEMGVYAGWVAHERSFAAGQVFFNERKDIALLFSGECFVDPGTGAELKRKGHELGEAAGSWLVHFYEEQGDRFFEKLNGLFSGLLIDKRRNRAFLFNDRYGVERIYFCETKDTTYFASEAKALLRILPELRAFDGEGVAQFLTYGCTLEWRTLFRGVQLLPGGSVWSFEGGTCYKRKYFSPETWEAQPALSVESYQSEFEETFRRILPRYVEPDADTGVSLTGGLDTRMIMACLPVTNPKYTCYTFVGANELTLDARLAAKIAASLGLEHQALRIGPDFLQYFDTYFDRTVYVTDGCAGAVSSHEIYFNGQARQISSVRLTGNFGSELLRSVSTFKPLGLQPQLLSDSYAKAVIAATQRATNDDDPHRVTFAAFREIPWGLFGLLAAGRSQVTFRTPYLDNDLVALAYRVPATLRRSPLSALRLIKRANPHLARIPTDRGELLGSSGVGRAFRRVFGEVTFKLDYYREEGLPTLLSPFNPLLSSLSSLGILGLHKFLPYRRWFREELGSTVLERLSSRRVREAPWWARNVAETLAKAHISGQGNYLRELNAITTLEAIDRLLLSEMPTEVSADRQEPIEVVA
jgi:asparagine synthase (glutamine-hydrolysing)